MAGFSLKRIREAFSKPKPGKGRPSDHRVHTRYRTLARVRIQGHTGEEYLLKDLSVTGCCVECTSLADILPDSEYILQINPEDSAKIGHFDLEVKTVWIRPAGYSGEVGFNIVASPKGRLFQRYVDYLSWREGHQPQASAG